MVETLTLSTSLLSALLAIVCLSTGRDRYQKVILTAFFFCVSLLTAIKYIFITTRFLHETPIFIMIPEVINVIMPQLIYLYTLSLIGKEIKKSLYLRMAILPVLSMFLFYIFYFLTNGFTQNRTYVIEGFILLYTLTFITYMLFMVLSLKEIRNVQHRIAEFSHRNQILMSWMKILIVLLLLRAFSTVIFNSLIYFYYNEPWFNTWIEFQKLFVVIILLIATLLTGYYVLRNPDFFENINEKPGLEQALAMAILTPESKKTVKKVFEDDELADYLNQLENKILTERLFLNPNLTQSMLAEQMNMPVYKLTFLLNKGANKNFNEFVNQFRVNHAINLLQDPKNHQLTIFAVALESGFASEAPFYTAFKKITGKSPAAFRNSLKN
jgi:AraC-like DNA-binding protein